MNSYARTMTDDKGRLKPTRVFQNALPPNCKTWHLVYYHFKDQFKTVDAMPERLEWDMIKANRELDLYKFDLDFIKARMFDESYSVLNEFFNNISGGQNYPLWPEYVRKLYNDYQDKVINGNR